MSDGHGSNPDTPPGWASNQPPPYGGEGAAPWAAPGAGQTPPPGPPPGQDPGNPYGQPPHQQQPYGQPPPHHQPHGGQPYGGQPYGGQPYGGQPYGGQPYGGQPYGGQPYGGQPYGGQPYGGTGPYGQPAPPYGGPPALKPGVIPLRPLNLGDIYNGAVQFIRSNPKATLGLSALVTILAEIATLAIQIPTTSAFVDAAVSETPTDPSDVLSIAGSFLLGTLLSVILQMIAIVVLSGMLTSVLGRAVFGESITIGEAWRLTRGRVLPLLGLALLQVLMIFGFMILAVVLVTVLVAANAPGALVGVVGFVFIIGGLVGAVFLYTKLSLAGPVIVLERAGVFSAISRSFRLVKGDFWRVFGILLLTAVIAGLIGGAVSVPFSFAAQVGTGAGGIEELQTGLTISLFLGALGAVIAGTITNPFSAAVNALLYADRRMRAEAFDLVLQTAATDRQRGVQSTAPEDLWHPSHSAGGPYGYGNPPQQGYGHPPQDPGAWNR
ncbi:hypothetical protein ACFFMN_12975 [Planobispora siamensis]|uniref:DUF7847 domain-containing protein n=1 Tax=Planobispora siamensis TaxID=936338 RepID=A0A8J3SAC6_9ACTN|nr:hypothetical protein [Planobispora siamensis]GIH89729.1 hypothetical protein Psi01_03590 [Planobispora siamensis]